VAIDRERVLAAAQKYVEKRRYDRAITEYEKIIQEDPNDARTLLKIGDLYSKADNYAEAVATYERVGRYYSGHGFSLKAIAVYKQIRDIVNRHASELGDRYAHIVPKLADLYQQLGLTSDAIAALEEVATRCQQTGRDAEAVDIFQRIVAFDTSNPIPHIRLAEGLSRIKDVDGAVAEFAIAAGQLVRQGRRDDALKVFERLLHHKPDPAHARIAADLYLARNGPNDGLQGLAKLQICFQANPRDLDTLALLSKAFTQIGQASKSIEVQKEIARLARDTGKLELFEEMVARLRKIVPDDEEVMKLAGVAREGIAPAAPPVDEGDGVSLGSDAPPPRADESRRSSDGKVLEDVLADSDIEEVEEVIETTEAIEPDQTGADIVADALTEAGAFRRARLLRKAADVLGGAILKAPTAIELHEELRDVLLDAQRVSEAVVEILVIAQLRADGGDTELAVQSIQDALAYESGNAKALEMLHALGYELAPGSDAGALGESDLGIHQPQEPEANPPSRLLNDGPLGPDIGMPFVSAAAGADISEIDAPFGESPLPAYPLVDTEPPSESAPPRTLRQPSRSPTAEIESSLDEAELCVNRGLYEDARAILRVQLARHPNHPLLNERMAEVDAAQGAEPGESGTRRTPGSIPTNDHSFSIAASLGALDDGDRVSGLGPGPSAIPANQAVDVEEVFAKFKEGVAKQIGFDDAQSHYDLGVAYKEMGLLDDAIREFETAAMDANRECVCQSMIGTIHLERGNLNEGIEAFLRGLQSPEHTREQEAALCYEIGAAYEIKKMSARALEYFGQTARLAPNFRDVHERIRKLQASESKRPPRAVAVGADDEFDRAFQDILTNSKIP